MQKLFFILVFTAFCFQSSAQNSTMVQRNPTTEEAEKIQKMNAIKGCEELNLQLTKLFGSNYSIDDKRVLAQLQKNIQDRKASRCIRKKSLYGIYGEDYVNKLHLIKED